MAAQCDICGLVGSFETSDSETDVIKKLLKIADAIFVPWKDQPIKCDTLDSQALWATFDSFFDKDWGCDGDPFVNLSLVKPDPTKKVEAEKKKKAEKAEHIVCDSIRRMLVKEGGESTTFQSFQTGPLWNFSRTGENLAKKGVLTEIREALGLEALEMHEDTKQDTFNGTPTPDQEEKWRINNDRREIDLLSIILSTETILQMETKSASESPAVKEALNKGIRQMTFLKKYLQRIHGNLLNNYWFLPALALPNKTLHHKCYHSKFVAQLEVKAVDLSIGRDANDNCNGSTVVQGNTVPKGDNKKYQICSRTAKGIGACGFFKWSDEADPLYHDDTASTCKCGSEPITITVPLQEKEPSKGTQKTTKEKKLPEKRMFQVCRNNQCSFFCWKDESHQEKQNDVPEPKHPVEVLSINACKNHIMVK